MRYNRSICIARSIKVASLLIFLNIGFAGFNQCTAQSVIGKWERTGTKFFVTDKASGKQTPVSSDKQQQYDKAAAERGYKETLEFKSGNIYTSTVTAGGEEPKIHNGNYSLSGKDLNMNIPLVNNEKTTITIQSLNDKTMIWDLVFMGKLTEIIYTKM
jgi:hypothetical protein